MQLDGGDFLWDFWDTWDLILDSWDTWDTIELPEILGLLAELAGQLAVLVDQSAEVVFGLAAAASLIAAVPVPPISLVVLAAVVVVEPVLEVPVDLSLADEHPIRKCDPATRMLEKDCFALRKSKSSLCSLFVRINKSRQNK